MKMTEIGEILKDDLVELLGKLGLDNYEAIDAASDEELRKVPGIGPATLAKLRAWVPDSAPIPEGAPRECVSLRYLVFGEGLSVRPGDVIPDEYAHEQIEKGNARWRSPTGT